MVLFKELYSGRSLFGAKGRGTTLSEVDYGAASCLPVVPILPEPVFISNTFFKLFSRGDFFSGGSVAERV